MPALAVCFACIQQRIKVLIYSMVYVSRNKRGREEERKKERKREAKYFSESTFMLGRAWGDWIIGDYSAELLGNITKGLSVPTD